MKKVVFDTNILLDDPHIIDKVDEDKEILLPSQVLEELDGLKKNSEVGYKARRANRKLEEEMDNISFEIKDIYENFPDGWDKDKRDNKIVLCARDNDAILFSNDINVRVKAKSIGVEVYGNNSDNISIEDEEYVGYRYVILNHQEQADFYNGLYELREDVFLNEYIFLKDEETGNIIDKFKVTEEGLDNVRFETVNTKHMGKIKPRNLQQELCFDMLQDKDIKIAVITGGFGVGKDYLMIAHSIDMIIRGIYDKLIWVRNTVEVKNSKPIGFLKGSMADKLIPFAMPLADHLGGLEGLNMFIDKGKIELQHLGFMRGRDIKNSIIYCSEAENMTKEHIQLLMGRVGEGSMLMINGDYKQTDEKVFEDNNGLVRIIDCLKGNKLFGYVKLDKVERSKVAQLADLLD